jgi:uncharacterized membrane-anchored protein YjiN (DUF445 family)
MTLIDPSHRLSDLLRSQVAALRERGGTARRSSVSAAGAASARDAASIAADRVRALSPDDPQRKETALRVFLESVLLQELGTELANDPSFPEMLQSVQAQMRSDPQISAAADELTEMLAAHGRA